MIFPTAGGRLRNLERIRTNLLKLFKAGDRYTAVMVSGSGTAANETALSSIIKGTDEVLLVKNGAFGERLVGFYPAITTTSGG